MRHRAALAAILLTVVSCTAERQSDPAEGDPAELEQSSDSASGPTATTIQRGDIEAEAGRLKQAITARFEDRYGGQFASGTSSLHDLAFGWGVVDLSAEDRRWFDTVNDSPFANRFTVSQVPYRYGELEFGARSIVRSLDAAAVEHLVAVGPQLDVLDDGRVEQYIRVTVVPDTPVAIRRWFQAQDPPGGVRIDESAKMRAF